MNKVLLLLLLILIVFGIMQITQFLKKNNNNSPPNTSGPPNPPNPNPPNPNPPNPNPQPKSGKVVNFTTSGDLSDVDYIYVESYDSSNLAYSNDIYPPDSVTTDRIGVLAGGYIIIYISLNDGSKVSKRMEDSSLTTGQVLNISYQNNNIVIN